MSVKEININSEQLTRTHRRLEDHEVIEEGDLIEFPSTIETALGFIGETPGFLIYVKAWRLREDLFEPDPLQFVEIQASAGNTYDGALGLMQGDSVLVLSGPMRGDFFDDITKYDHYSTKPLESGDLAEVTKSYSPWQTNLA
jgi:hypothetical protein